jgi:hypothetical protein
MHRLLQKQLQSVSLIIKDYTFTIILHANQYHQIYIILLMHLLI